MSPALRKRLIVLATVLGSSMAFIDGSVVNVALPAIQRDLGASAAAVQWVMNAYLLLLGALVLVGGAAADRFGRRRVFLVGIGLFTAASVACGLAPNAEVLVIARAAQGAGAAMLTPASLAVLGSSFEAGERGQAIGAWAGFGALTAAIGPVLGGWLSDHVTWRAIFFINVPIAAAAVAVALTAVPESRDPEAKRLDVIGAALAAGGLGAITWALAAAPGHGFTLTVWGAIGLGCALLAGFLAHEARAREPMTPLGLFKSLDFSGLNLLTLLLYFALSGALFFLPFQLIRVEDYSAAAAGATFLPFSAVMGLFSPLAGRLGDRFGPRLPLTVGPMITAAGFLLLAFLSHAFWTGVLPAIVVVAVGMTIAVAPLTTAVMGAVPNSHAGTASGINNAVARIAGLLAIAVLSLVFAAGFDASVGPRLDRLDTPVDQRPARGSALALSLAPAATPLGEAERAAFTEAYRLALILAAACAAGGGAAGFLMVRGKRARE